MKWNETTRLKLVSWYLFVFGLGLAIWWPISHWFFSDWYHSLLGFEIGSYPDNMVKMIGTSGLVPVFLMLSSSKDPKKYRSNIIIITVFGFLLAATNLYLLARGTWPIEEVFNIFLAILSSLILLILYPWREERPA